jgi:hypothetical protein
MSLRALTVLIAASLVLAGCGIGQSSASPASQVGRSSATPPSRVSESSATPASRVSHSSATPASQAEVHYRCSIENVPGDVTPTSAQMGYGVIDLTIVNETVEPFDPNNYQVYVFSSPGVQDGTANVPESWKGDVAPGAQETFAGGDLWPRTDTCSLGAAG